MPFDPLRESKMGRQHRILDDDDDDIRFCIAALRPVTAYVAATYLYTSYVCTTSVGDEM